MRRLVIGVVVGLLAVSGCGDDDDASDATEPAATDAPAGTDAPAATDAPAGDGATLEISGFAFPEDLTAAAGSTLSIVNADSATHSVTATDGAFDVEVAGGESGSLTVPSEPGSYEFRCNFHGSMQGTLVVE